MGRTRVAATGRMAGAIPGRTTAAEAGQSLAAVTVGTGPPSPRPAGLRQVVRRPAALRPARSAALYLAARSGADLRPAVLVALTGRLPVTVPLAVTGRR